MARWFVGQPVRFVRATTAYGRTLLGQEGRITALGDILATNRETYESMVTEAEVTMIAGNMVGCNTDQLEPIIPDGHQPAELSVEELLPFVKEKEKVTI